MHVTHVEINVLRKLITVPILQKDTLATTIYSMKVSFLYSKKWIHIWLDDNILVINQNI